MRKENRSSPEPRSSRRDITLHPQFWNDLRYWARTDRKLEERLFELVEAVARDPFAGIGKPEILKHDFQGCWSRRLSEEHRIVYRVTSTAVEFLSARGHYPKQL